MSGGELLPVTPETIPHELTERAQWVVWVARWDRKRGKWNKVPHDAKTGKLASSTDPGTWATFPEALAAYQGGQRYAGVGYVLAAEDPFTGIDLDHARTGGELSEDARAIVARFPGMYWEVSPSGTGVHGIGRATLPPGVRKRGDVELYDTARFFTVTGHQVAGAIGADCSEAVAAFHRETFGEPAKRTRPPQPATPSAEDAEIVRRCQAFDHEGVFAPLWSGNRSGYGSPSEADSALLMKLLWANGGDVAQAVRIARTSPAWREKWDEPRGAVDWLTYSAERARDAMHSFYTPGGGAPAAPPRWGKVSDTGESPVSESNQLVFRTAREIAETVPAAVPWLCHGLVARGVITEVDGKAKRAGKTTFLMAMIAAMRSGSDFLGLATQPAGVVYLSEQTPGTLRGALMRAGLGEAESVHLMSYADTKGMPWPEVAALAVEYAGEVGAGLLVVDTLPQYAGLQGDSENQSGAALAAMLPLQLAAGAGLAVVAVRHDRKGGGAVGESGRGSSAYAGAVDIVAQLAKPDGFTRPGIRHLSTLSRFDESPESLVFELTETGYIAHGDETAVKTKEARTAIVAALPDAEADALTKNALAEEAEVSRTLAGGLIDGLVESGIAVRYGTGKRGDAYRFARAGEAATQPEKPGKKVSDTPKNVVLSETFLKVDSVLLSRTDGIHTETDRNTQLLSDTTSHIEMTETNESERERETHAGARRSPKRDTGASLAHRIQQMPDGELSDEERAALNGHTAEGFRTCSGCGASLYDWVKGDRCRTCREAAPAATGDDGEWF